MNYISVCSGIEAASVAWHPLGWLDRWVDFCSGLTNSPQRISIKFANVRKSVTVGADDHAIFKRVHSAARALNDMVGIARCLCPSASHAPVAKHSAQSAHPTAWVGVHGALCEYVALPLVPRCHAKAIPSVGRQRVYRSGLARVVPLDEPARASFCVHRRHLSQASAFAKACRNDQSLSLHQIIPSRRMRDCT